MGLGKLCPHCGERSFMHKSGLFFCNFCDIEDANDTICDVTTGPSHHEPVPAIQESVEDMELEATGLQNTIIADRTPSRKRSQTLSVSSPGKRRRASDVPLPVSCGEADVLDGTPSLDEAAAVQESGKKKPTSAHELRRLSKDENVAKRGSRRQLTLTDMFKKAAEKNKAEQSNICSSNRMSKSGISDADDSFRDPLANSTCDESGLSTNTPKTGPSKSLHETLEPSLSTIPSQASPREKRSSSNKSLEKSDSNTKQGDNDTLIEALECDLVPLQQQTSPCKNDEELRPDTTILYPTTPPKKHGRILTEAPETARPQRTSPRKKRSNSINEAAEVDSPKQSLIGASETARQLRSSPRNKRSTEAAECGPPKKPHQTSPRKKRSGSLNEAPEKLTPDPKDTSMPTSPGKTKNKIVEEADLEKFGAWCSYNYILKGIVDELIDLGAKKDLRKTVKVLWYKYLRTVGAFGNEPRDKRIKCGLFGSRKKSGASKSEPEPGKESETDELGTDTESKKRRKGAVTREKLFSIVYLSLLLNKDTIQLGDLLRFIKECRLSYLYLRHFVPEEVSKKTRVVGIHKMEAVFAGRKLRSSTHKIAALLDVKERIPVQNLVELCKRYCKELNLSDDVFVFTKALVSATRPRMRYWKTSRLIHNYEARAMSFIVFALKLLFGMDNATEHSMSALTKSLNHSKRYFDFDEWLSHLKCRRAMVDHLMSTTYVKNLQGMLEKVAISKVEQRVERLLGKCVFDDRNLKLPEYKNFSQTKLTYLTDPQCYGDLNVDVVCKGANKDIRTISPKKTWSQERRKMRSTFECSALSLQEVAPEETPCKRSKFVNVDEARFEEISRRFKGGQGDKVTLYLPEEQFWLCQCEDAGQMSHEEFDEYFKMLPNSFRAIVSECTRIIEQSEREVMAEYNLLETYLCYISKDNVPSLPLHFFDATLERLIEKYKLVW